MSLKAKLLKNSTIKETSILTDSIIYNQKSELSTPVPMINVALSGKVDGGLTSGFTMIAGPSRHFKTAFALLLASAYLKANGPDAMILFYDTEFGTPQSYIRSFGIDPSQIIHTPITDIEQLKHDLVTQLGGIERGDKVLVMIDSIGNIASKKELDDALEGKTVADMTRARALKSLFRMVTGKLNLKDLPLVGINHTYMTLEMFSKAVVGGGTGAMYAADNVWIVGRQQEKTAKDGHTGYNFTINIEKSRYVREKSKVDITVSFEGGINKWSGLFEQAEEAGFITSEKKGFYLAADPDTGEVPEAGARKSDIEFNGEYWKRMLKNKEFTDFITKKYRLDTERTMIEEDTPEEV